MGWMVSRRGSRSSPPVRSRSSATSSAAWTPHAISASCISPARVFMGDTGALAIGGALGTVAILLKTEFLLVIAGAVFVAETVSVLVQTTAYKWRKRRYGKEYADAHRVFRMAPL